MTFFNIKKYIFFLNFFFSLIIFFKPILWLKILGNYSLVLAAGCIFLEMYRGAGIFLLFFPGDGSSFSMENVLNQESNGQKASGTKAVHQNTRIPGGGSQGV